MEAHHQDAASGVQLCANEYSVSVRVRGVHPGVRLWIYALTQMALTDWQGHLLNWEQVSLPGLWGAELPLCPRATLPCAVGLAARYIKTGASVTESALWKLRGLADGHFWRSWSIIKMKSSDWAGLACSVPRKRSSLLLLLFSTLTLYPSLSLSVTGYWGSGGRGNK